MHDRLTEASRLHEALGYGPIAGYNGHQSATRWFEKSLA